MAREQVVYKGQKLKLAPSMNPLQAVPDEPVLARDANLGGLGMHWYDVPQQLTGEGLLEWEHLAEQFRDQPTRFREADRRAVTAYCECVDLLALATDELRGEGLMVKGRSNSDADRMVKNAAWSMWRNADTAVRAWANALALTPTARRRSGGSEAAVTSPEDNPFLPRQRPQY